jgi:hypothetical protein
MAHDIFLAPSLEWWSGARPHPIGEVGACGLAVKGLASLGLSARVLAALRAAPPPTFGYRPRRLASA